MNLYRVSVKDELGNLLHSFDLTVDGGPGLWLAASQASRKLDTSNAGHSPDAWSVTVRRIDKYDAANMRGYQDGLNDRPSNPPDDDSAINYTDGYADGDFRRREEAGAFDSEAGA